MGKIARIIAFLFRAVNFFFDCLQTWQYTGGGSMSGVIAAIIAFYQGLPYWMLPFVAVAAGVLVTILLALIFKSFAAKKHEEKRLQKLSRLVLDIHKRISAIRARLIRKTNWDKIDKDKVIEPMATYLLGNPEERKNIKLDDDVITKGTERLKKIGSRTGGAPSVLDSVMKKSDTSLDKELEKDFRYQYLLAKLDGYKPYPNGEIRNSVKTLLDSSISGNNAILWLQYSPSESFLSFVRSSTDISEINAQEMQIANENAEKRINDAIDIRTTQLRKEIEEYLKQRL